MPHHEPPEYGSVVWAREPEDDPMWPAFVADSRPGKPITVIWLGYGGKGKGDPPLGSCRPGNVVPFVGATDNEKHMAKALRDVLNSS
eukprot:tig00020782_g13704.t1